MQRTYDVFVDNGLFILAYYLDKGIEEITEEDVFNNIDMMCEKIYEYTNCEKYANLKSMMFYNSALTQTNSNIKLDSYLKDFEKSIGNEMCSCCGNSRADILNNSLHRSYLPNYVANTFYNFSNNLKGINVCGLCAILTMFSILNSRVNRLAYLYNSDNDEFMYDYTYERQQENNIDIITKAKKTKKSDDNFTTIEFILSKNKVYGGYIQIYRFNNSGQTQDLEMVDIRSDNVKLLSNISRSGMLNEFKQHGLTHDLITDKISYTYLNKITKNDELICSKELFEILNREVNKLNENIINAIKNVCSKLENTTKVRKKLKLISTFKEYERYLVELADEYADSHNDNLYTVEEYILLDNRIKYNQIKNLMIVSLL